MGTFRGPVRGGEGRDLSHGEEKGDGGDKAERVIDGEEEIVVGSGDGVVGEGGEARVEEGERGYRREKKKWRGESNPTRCPSFSQLAASEKRSTASASWGEQSS